MMLTRMVLSRTMGMLFVFMLLNTVVLGEEVRINQQTIVFLYEARVENRLTDEQLAEKISIDFRNATDEFTRHELMERIRPVIEKRITEAANTKDVYLLVGVQLGEYDFEKKRVSHNPWGRHLHTVWRNQNVWRRPIRRYVREW